MAESEATLATPPQIVEYDPITGIPSEFNEFLPKDCEEFAKWKAAREDGLAGQMATLSAGDGAASQPAAAPAPAETKASSSSKKKKKNQPAGVVLERNTRNKKKCITTIAGLDLFGVKLPEAAKLFGKKFASGSSVTKNGEGQAQIDVQGDVLDQVAELIIKQYKEVSRQDIYYMEAKKKERYFDDGDDEEGTA